MDTTMNEEKKVQISLKCSGGPGDGYMVSRLPFEPDNTIRLKIDKNGLVSRVTNARAPYYLYKLCGSDCTLTHRTFYYKHVGGIKK